MAYYLAHSLDHELVNGYISLHEFYSLMSVQNAATFGRQSLCPILSTGQLDT